MNLLQDQYNEIGVVARHCDNLKLTISENEASNFDLADLFCDFWEEIENINAEIIAYESDSIPPIPENYTEKCALLRGGTYLDCKNKPRVFEGVYKILAYYSYSRYIVLNGFSDTPNGLVQKTNEFSIPKTLKELELFADKYRNMGFISFGRTVKYICKNTNIFDFNHCSKVDCNCGDEDCGTTKAKGYGFKGLNVNK